MNTIIGAGVGVVLAFFGVIGGVSAYTSGADGVAQSNLYNYSDS